MLRALHLPLSDTPVSLLYLPSAAHLGWVSVSTALAVGTLPPLLQHSQLCLLKMWHCRHGARIDVGAGVMPGRLLTWPAVHSTTPVVSQHLRVSFLTWQMRITGQPHWLLPRVNRGAPLEQPVPSWEYKGHLGRSCCYDLAQKDPSIPSITCKRKSGLSAGSDGLCW